MTWADGGGHPTFLPRDAGVARGAGEVARGLGVKNIALTITHDGNTALALVIFEG